MELHCEVTCPLLDQQRQLDLLRDCHSGGLFGVNVGNAFTKNKGGTDFFLLLTIRTSFMQVINRIVSEIFDYQERSMESAYFVEARV